ncbi:MULTISPECIES: nuclear transport factor 2 family protein [unclassified Mycobacteroides]|uniref:YybH family protein n=1 Tax=unclassified Mycobacteroides TaxID=2618759 RepID=UPI0012DDFC3B|nr:MULTISPECIES: nuclear transport factor 2 family protein [unclassified Mycobacteroides]
MDIEAALDRFVAAFNTNDLDMVMQHFAEDAEYLPGNGSRHVGPSEIRREFEPQFNGVYGAMTFDEHDRMVDVGARKATIRWTCRHDISVRRSRGRLLGVATRIGALVFPRFGWEGLDVFHFDDQGKITGKYTYSNYALPRISRRLG